MWSITQFHSTLASNSGDIFVAIGVLGVLAVTVMIIGIVLHRKITSDRSSDRKPLSFDLQQLRQMHQDGQLTQAEYDRATAALAARQSAAANLGPTAAQQQSNSTPNTPHD